ncbi:hypothetical protein LTR05_001934 [Lithohypha guttulata]|uniref:Uncharacterized protein n=1 Tax=Lithohypha guttulata TaxID=1690604 RepID=A0AAN7T7A8_9EURO|nr:hypothetical protein LTR05_001934 [Lithohypha guttulata]
MAQLLPRRAHYVCKACRSAQAARPIIRAFSTTLSRAATLRQQLEGRSSPIPNKKSSGLPAQVQRPKAGRPGINPPSSLTPQKARKPANETAESTTPPPASKINSNALLTKDSKLTVRSIQEDALAILESEEVPDEATVLAVLQRAQELADVLVQTQPLQGLPQSDLSTEKQGAQTSSTSNDGGSLFVELNEPQVQARQEQDQVATPLPASALSIEDRRTLAFLLVKALYPLLEDPKVYISERILTFYVEIATTLQLPQYLPKILHLYAHKQIPKPGSHPIQYSEPWSSTPKYAVPHRLADLAIESAISIRDMPLAISLIDETVATTQFKWAKFIKKAAFPLTLASSVIPLAWTLSSRAARWQISWEEDTFFWMCISGSSAYIGTMGILLYITVTTWNDHHKRVRWIPGTNLWPRWVREEERYYLDRIALAWGYQDVNRHGEETGEEWEALRELLLRRQLELDRSALLPGML